VNYTNTDLSRNEVLLAWVKVAKNYSQGDFIVQCSKAREVNLASFPGLPPFFVLRFAFSIIHGSGRVRKTGKAWEHLSRE